MRFRQYNSRTQTRFIHHVQVRLSLSPKPCFLSLSGFLGLEIPIEQTGHDMVLFMCGIRKLKIGDRLTRRLVMPRDYDSTRKSLRIRVSSRLREVLLQALLHLQRDRHLPSLRRYHYVLSVEQIRLRLFIWVDWELGGELPCLHEVRRVPPMRCQ